MKNHPYPLKQQAEADQRAENERITLQKLLLRYDPTCSHCGKDISAHWRDSVLVIGRLACVDHVETVKAAAMADNQKGLDA